MTSMDESINLRDLVTEDEDGNQVLTGLGEQFQVMMDEAVIKRVDDRIDELCQAIDRYFAEEVEPLIEGADQDELRNLMAVAVEIVGGKEARAAFYRKVAALARTGTLSAASAEWAQGSPSASDGNRDSIRGDGQSRPVNDEYEVDLAKSVFDEVSGDLDDVNYSRLIEACAHLKFDAKTMSPELLKEQVTAIRRSVIDGEDPQIARYSQAISRLNG